MRSIEGPQTPFEVYCANCKVTFPIGTRRCVHCGGRVIAPDRRRTLRSMPSARPAEDTGRRSPSPLVSAGPQEASNPPTLEELTAAGVPGPVLPDDDIDEMIPARRFSPTTTLWILLAVTGAALRICGGG